MNIAILEDNPGVGRLFEKGLGREHTVHVANTVRDFFSFIAASENVDLIIVDYRLISEHGEEKGNLSGADVIRAVRKTLPNLPAIVISAASLGVLQAACDGLSRLQILQKPFKMDYLRETIQTLIANK